MSSSVHAWSDSAAEVGANLWRPVPFAATLDPVSQRRVAIARCRRSSDADAGDHYPDPDAGPIASSLEARGLTVESVSWDDPSTCWEDFTLIVISSTWDSVDHPDEYLAWAEHVSTCARLANPSRVLRWGIDKTHQIALAAAGVAVVPTTWVAPGQPWTPPAGDYVIKPAVSAGGRSTARYRGDSSASQAHVAALHAAGKTVMAQPYIASIDADGETDLIYLGGAFSHAVRKLPALTPGRGVIERPWEQMAWAGVATPTVVQLQEADRVVAEVARLTGSVPAYARVDLLNGDDKRPLLLEVEVVDPYLSLDLVPEASDRFADALLCP